MNRLQCVYSTLLFTLLTSGLALTAATADSGHDVTDPDGCQTCHKAGDAMLGIHGGKHYGPTNLVAGCADCHGTGKDSELHERDASDVVRFRGFVLSPEHLNIEGSPVELQNTACLTCHPGTDLRVAHWTHDPHAKTLSCASCHRLHPRDDPMRGLSRLSTIKLCVDCHAEQADQTDNASTGGVK